MSAWLAGELVAAYVAGNVAGWLCWVGLRWAWRCWAGRSWACLLGWPGLGRLVGWLWLLRSVRLTGMEFRINWHLPVQNNVDEGGS